MAEKNLSLAAKLVKVMAGVKSVAKNGRNDFQNYDYVTEKDLIDSIRENLIKENVFLISSIEGSHREGDLTSVMVKHTFIDGDSEEVIETKSLGTGSDKGDKGAYKAYTGAMKYMLQKCFLIPTGDDPEATDVNGKPTLTKSTTKLASGS